MALVKPGGERTEHKVYETTNRTCYLCHRPVSQIDDTYFVYEKDFVLCADHKDDDGFHGQLAAREDKPYRAMQVVQFLHSSRFKEGTSTKRRKKEAAKQRIKPADDELDEGDMIPEVAEFLKKMGKM